MTTRSLFKGALMLAIGAAFTWVLAIGFEQHAIRENMSAAAKAPPEQHLTTRALGSFWSS